MRSGFGVCYGDFGDTLRRGVGIEGGHVGVQRVGMRGENTAVTGRCVFAQTDVDGEQ